MSRPRFQMVVDGEVFYTKKAVRERCQAILQSRKPGEVLSEEQQRFLTSLVSTYHPESDLKVGVGVGRIRVDRDGYGYRCFWIDRVDGSSTDFSFNSCVSHPTVQGEVKSAFRNAVYMDILAFKSDRLLTVDCCEFSGVPLVEGDIHVDHQPPLTFDALVLAFMKKCGLDWQDIPVSPTADNVVGSWLTDPALASEWRTYHAEHAVLRLVTKKANLSGIKRSPR